jgi:DNA polymerase-3 subunit beta
MKELNRPEVQISSRLIEGEYPNYQDIIPKRFKTRVILKRDEFLNQVKVASLFSGKINEVKIAVKPEQKEIDVLSQSPDIGENKSSLPAKIDGEEMQVSFNYKFLIDGLNSIKSSEVIFELSEKEGPCVLKPVGDTSYLYVVMPIKSA